MGHRPAFSCRSQRNAIAELHTGENSHLAVAAAGALTGGSILIGQPVTCSNCRNTVVRLGLMSSTCRQTGAGDQSELAHHDAVTILQLMV